MGRHALSVLAAFMEASWINVSQFFSFFSMFFPWSFRSWTLRGGAVMMVSWWWCFPPLLDVPLESFRPTFRDVASAQSRSFRISLWELMHQWDTEWYAKAFKRTDAYGTCMYYYTVSQYSVSHRITQTCWNMLSRSCTKFPLATVTQQKAFVVTQPNCGCSTGCELRVTRRHLEWLLR